jgi:tetratricopeptide (TPR) repeat protein
MTVFPLLVVLLAPVHHTISQESSEQVDDLTAEQRELLAERDQLRREVQNLRGDGKLAEAVERVERIVSVERELFGEVHLDIARSLDLPAKLHVELDRFAGAERTREEALDIKTRLFGERHWRVTDARLALEDARWFGKATAEERERRARADTLHAEARQHFNDGDVRQALEIDLEVLKTRKDVLGVDHPDVAITHENIGFICSKAGVLDDAEQQYRASLAIQRRSGQSTSAICRDAGFTGWCIETTSGCQSG